MPGSSSNAGPRDAATDQSCEEWHNLKLSNFGIQREHNLYADESPVTSRIIFS